VGPSTVHKRKENKKMKKKKDFSGELFRAVIFRSDFSLSAFGNNNDNFCTRKKILVEILIVVYLISK
jgi:hypothetical protein